MSNDNFLHWKNWANLNPQQRLNVAVSLAIQNSPMCQAIHQNGYKKDFTYGVGSYNDATKGGAYVKINGLTGGATRAKLVCDTENSKNPLCTTSQVAHELVHVSSFSRQASGDNNLMQRLLLPENLIAWMMIEEAVAYSLESEFEVRFLSQDPVMINTLREDNLIMYSTIDYLAAANSEPNKNRIFQDNDVLFGFIQEAKRITEDKGSRACIRQKYVKNLLMPPAFGMDGETAEHIRFYVEMAKHNIDDNLVSAKKVMSCNVIPKKWALNVDDVTHLYSWGNKQFLTKDQWNEVFDGMNPVSFVRHGIRNAGLGDSYNRSIGVAAKFVGLPFNPI